MPVPPADSRPEIPGFDADRADQYLRGTAGRPPRETLLQALACCTAPGEALDLGCGAGLETAELLRRGWRVTATDALAEMIARTEARIRTLPAEAAARCTLLRAGFDATPLPEGAFDLVHAGFSLPFATEAQFPALWPRLCASIRPGGLFAGQLFGPRDQFVVEGRRGDMNAHDAEGVRTLLRGFDLLHHEEVDRDGQTAAGCPKHWHVHHVIARRRSGG